jgi:hypothetical protein
MVQMLLHFSMPAFPGSDWIEPLFSVIIFVYGGCPSCKWLCLSCRTAGQA